MNKLPRYKISIDDPLEGETPGITMVAYTNNPAIVTKGLAFANTSRKLIFSDILLGRLAAPALIPDLPIYRQDDELGEYEVIFDKETIEKLRSLFMKNKGKTVFNLDHDDELKAPSFILDSWITGPSETDSSFSKYGIKVPEGSWFVVSQFEDMDYFQKEIIEKGRTGLSIEGFLGLILNSIKTNIKQNKMKEIFETKINLPDGEYKDSNGKVFIVKDGILIEDAPVDAPVEDVKADMADAPVVDAPVVDAPVDVPVDAPVVDNKEEALILAVIQPKLDELYKVIADLKTLVETSKIEDVKEDVILEAKTDRSVVALSSFFDNLNQ